MGIYFPTSAKVEYFLDKVYPKVYPIRHEAGLVRRDFRSRVDPGDFTLW